MAVLLPSSPAPTSITPRLVTRRTDLEPTFGGPVTRIQRLGTRWALDVEMPPMDYIEAMAWIAALTAADAETVVLNLPQPLLEIGNPGTPLTDGAGQVGKIMRLDGFTPSYPLKAGQWASLVMGGQRYLHMVRADKAATSSGLMDGLLVEPMLRRAPADNTVVEVAEPKIEGFLSGRETSWTVDRAMFVGIAFSITERE